MEMEKMFGSAKWISSEEEYSEGGVIIRRHFFAKDKESAFLTLIGLGTFEVFINGARVSEDYFLPLNSEYENCGEPQGEELSYRIYAVEYDVSKYLNDGDNLLAVHLGYGWYTGTNLWGECYKKYGGKKLIYKMRLGCGEAMREIYSSGEESYVPSYLISGNMHHGEVQDFRSWNSEALLARFFDKDLPRVKFVSPVKSDYLFTDCPPDRVSESILPTLIYKKGDFAIYDVGKNTSAIPVLNLRGKRGDAVEVVFSEDILPSEDALDPERIHSQKMTFICDGERREAKPSFTWFGFRYFSIKGDALPVRVDVIHSSVRQASAFTSDSPVLNWIYSAFVNSQLSNMHRGIPSDCPHIERLGYTGDGQLTSRSVMMTLATKSFYKKWIGDISDCQDKKTGHVQYTAPYVLAGGGPGGWGSAIVTVPYEYWRAYGETDVLYENFDGMLAYLDYLDAHSKYGLVSDGLPCTWCLGDWCTPPDQSNLTAKFVNTYFYVKSAERIIEIAHAIGREEVIQNIEARMNTAKAAINEFYYNGTRDNTYLGNVKGASAFALDIGLGNSVTEEKLVRYYTENPYYDTGIFGTEVVTRVLFERGYPNVALSILTASEPHGFGKWMSDGRTSLLEYWGGKRSHNHPMFGAVTALLFEYILGIRQEKNSAGYEKIIISPSCTKTVKFAKGHIDTVKGRISVEYKSSDERTKYKISIPDGASAKLILPSKEEIPLSSGENLFES